jgi:hypothetical protein
MKDDWIEFEERQHGPNGENYISLNGHGEFWMNNMLFEKFGRPEAVTLHFAPNSNRIGMRKAEASLVNAIRVRERQSSGWAVRSRAFIRKWEIKLNGTYIFPDLQIEDDMLVLPLDTRFNVSYKKRQ